MPDFVVLALGSALYPTLLAISVVLLNTPHPRPMLLGYLGGALTASIASGLAIVFVLADTDAVNDSKPTVSPIVDIVSGALCLALAWVIATGRVDRLRARRRAKHPPRPKSDRPGWSSRLLAKGSISMAFGVAMILSIAPGLFYLVALKDIAAADYGVVVSVVLVLVFNVVQFALIEIPLVAYTVAPEGTAERMDRFNAGLRRHARSIGLGACLVIGLYLVARGAAGLA